MGEKRNSYNILVEIVEGKRPLGRSRHRRQDDNKRYFKDTVYEYAYMYWIQDSSSSG
jgi:hypothetical protein